MHNTLTTQRVFAVDTFRGITILVMVFVNDVAGVKGIPQWMTHMPADADAMTFVDVVFPAFLFIVGMSIPFAINIRRKKGDSWWKLQGHILIRTLGLLVLGVFMVNAENGYNEEAMEISIGLWSLLFYGCAILVWNVYEHKSRSLVIALRSLGIIGLLVLGTVYRGGESGEAGLAPQWWGILGLIGWAYLIGCLLYQAMQGHKWLLLLAMLFCLSWFVVAKSGGDNPLIQWMDSQKGHAIHTSLVLCGMVLSLIFFDQKINETLRSRFIKGFVLMALTGAVAFILRPFYQISKIYATPSWAMYSATICIGMFMILYWMIDVRRKQSWTNIFKPAATNPLLTYIIPYIVLALLMTLNVNIPDILRAGMAGILWSAVYAVAVIAFVVVLNKWKIRLQL